MLDDIGNPSAAVLARAMGVCERTAYRWKRSNLAPRAVMLAIFWQTRWGRSVIDARATNEAAMHAGMAECLQREVQSLRRELARVLAAGDFGSANRPTMRDVAPRHLRVASVAPGFGDPFAQARELADDERAHDGAADDQQATA